jgi:uncharacterized protein (DUF1501 family)
VKRDRLDRRSFLCAACAPLLLPRGPLLRWLPRGDERILVVVELEGGNDGLNTLIPLDDEHYRKARPRLSAVRSGALALADGYGLHGELRGLHRLVQQGRACCVHAVGYPDPDRSHFRSRDIWHAADPRLVKVAASTTGWLGRAADWLAARGAALPGAVVGGMHVPLVLHGTQAVVPLLQRAEDYQLLVDPAGGRSATDARRKALLDLLAGAADPASTDLQASVGALAARAAAGAEQLGHALERHVPRAVHPDTALGRDLQLVARVAVAGTGTRLFHVGFGGFDTHARQLATQAGLLRQLGDALAAFADDLHGHGLLDRTVVLVHSEFGRRVAENQSQGTDHGAAAPVFLVGGAVKAGLHGKAPDLGKLVDGDVAVAVDFRQVYSELLAWLGVDHAAILGQPFAALGLFA